MSSKIINAEEKALLLDLVKIAAPMGVKVATGTMTPTNVKTALSELARVYPAAHKQALARFGGTRKKKNKKTGTAYRKKRGNKNNRTKSRVMTPEEDPVRLNNIYQAANALQRTIRDHVMYPNGRTKQRLGASFLRLMRHYNSEKKNQRNTNTNKKTRSAQIAQDKLAAEMNIIHKRAMSLQLEKQVRSSKKRRDYENVYNKNMQAFSTTLDQVTKRMQGYDIRLRNKTLPHQQKKKNTRSKPRK